MENPDSISWSDTSAFETGRRRDTGGKYVVICIVRRYVSIGQFQGSQSSLDEISRTDVDKMRAEEELCGRKKYEILILEMGNRAYGKVVLKLEGASESPGGTQPPEFLLQQVGGGA